MIRDDCLAWLRSFEGRHGRPLRVLHVGNIANNAYLNAKFLRSVGVDAHVVCRDYDHVMATPEWEEVELLRPHGDDLHPVFAAEDLGAYRRPSWFVSGSLPSCVMQVEALRGKEPSRLRKVQNQFVERAVSLTNRLFGSWPSIALRQCLTEPSRFAYNLLRGLESLSGLSIMNRWAKPTLPIDHAPAYRVLIDDFDRLFPERPDRLTAYDIIPFQSAVKAYRDMFRHYDIVQCYATDPIFGLLADKRPIVAFEHGTLRAFTMGDVPLHRLNALAYRKADHVLITNGDCLAYAKRLGIEAYSPMIHPIDVEQHRRDYGDAIQALRGEIGADVILFCPTRHDWDIKGTDRFIRALPLIKQRASGRVKLVLVRWGLNIAESEALIGDLDCEDDVVWRPTLSRITMIKHIRAADVVLDQMVLPVFGSTAPQAIAAGKPVISSYVPEETLWLIPEPAPTLSAFSSDDVAAAVAMALDPAWRADYEKRARYWTDRYHHPDNVISQHLGVYRKLLQGDGRDALPASPTEPSTERVGRQASCHA